MRKNIVAGLLTGLLLVCSASPSHALKVTKEGSPDTFFKLNFLMQPFLQLDYLKGGDPALTHDIFVRRTRFLFGGKFNKMLGFFMETDVGKLGAGRSFDQALFVQDAIVMVNFSKAFNLNIGMFLPGFARDFFTSAVALHGFDYQGAQAPLAYPGLGGTKVWRDSGIQALGWLADDKFEYRFSISTGANNPDKLPRMTLRLAYNLLDAEAKLFPAATYLGKKKVVSIGVAADLQPDGYGIEVPGATEDDPPTTKNGLYMGVAGDIMWDLPMAGDKRLTGSAGLVFYKLDEETQIGTWFDIGMAFGKFEPMIAVHWVKMPGAEDFDGHHFDIHAALMHWTFGHNFNLKLDVGIIKKPGVKFFEDNTLIQTTIRSQFFF